MHVKRLLSPTGIYKRDSYDIALVFVGFRRPETVLCRKLCLYEREFFKTSAPADVIGPFYENKLVTSISTRINALLWRGEDTCTEFNAC